MTAPGPGDEDSGGVFTFHVQRRTLVISGVVALIVVVALLAFFVGKSSSSGSATNTTEKRSTTTSPSRTSSTTTIAPSSTTTTPPTTTAPLTYVAPCAPSTNPMLKPATIYLACGSGNVSLTNISWSSWGSSEASGTGTYNVNDCVPYCASGHFASIPATVTMTNPTSAGGAVEFGSVNVVPSDGSASATANLPNWGGA